MRDSRTVQVVINLTITPQGLYHWFVTTSEELQTIQWADDGSLENGLDAATQALTCAHRELGHFVRGGAVRP